MARSNKANLLWIDAVGGAIAERLSVRHIRPIIYRQSGPYTQDREPHVGIYFSDPILHHIAPAGKNQSVDFRFGYYLERSYHGALSAGFENLSSTLAARFLMPNMRRDAASIAKGCQAWLRRQPESGRSIQMGQNGGVAFSRRGDEDLDDLHDALTDFGTLRRNAELLKWRRYRFSATFHLAKYYGWPESRLTRAPLPLLDSILGTFAKLDFLYTQLFPRDIGPARLSNGQNRALKAKQPDRRCSWLAEECCRGVVHAAHIKPDRLGGHAIPSNLFWLCNFHHTLLDTYLKADLSIHRPSRRIIASVSALPPEATKAGGIPHQIHQSIEDKRAWCLPLRPESISHLFD